MHSIPEREERLGRTAITRGARALGLRYGDPEEAGLSAVRLDALRARASAWVEQGLTRSLVYLVARDGVVAAHECFGHLGYEPDAPRLTPDAVFSIASVTKPITALAVMILVEEGLLSLNRPLTELLPEISGRGTRGILVHQLLTHTSGYSAAAARDRLRAAFAEPWEPQPDASAPHEGISRLLQACYPLEPSGPPGELSRYAGVNYLFLGEIVRRVSGRRLEDFARERIFEPLGMHDTSFGLPPSLASRRVRPDPDIYRGFPDYDPNDPRRLSLPHPAGGVFSTARDMAVLCQMFLDGGRFGGVEILSPAGVAAMTTNQIPGIGTIDGEGRHVAEASWGLGWMVQGAARWKRAHGTLQPIGTFYHQGASGAGVWVEPVSGVVGVFLSVLRHMDPETEEFHWEFDRFQNMVTAAVLPRARRG